MLKLFKLPSLEKQLYEKKKSRNIRIKKLLEANEIKVQRKIVGKAKINRIRSQQIRESRDIQPINE